MSGGKIATFCLLRSQTVSDLKVAIASEEPRLPAFRQCIILGHSHLTDGSAFLDTLVSPESDSLSVLVVCGPYKVELATESAFGMLVNNGGCAAELIEHPDLMTGWGVVRAKYPLPRGERASWFVSIHHVAHCGDVVVGVRHEPTEGLQLEPGDKYTSFCLVAVGSPSGMIAINKGSHDFGVATENYMIMKTARFAEPVTWEQGDGAQVTVVWNEGMLSFAVNGANEKVAFRSGPGEHDLPPDGCLYPFITCYGRGTAVCISNTIEGNDRNDS